MPMASASCVARGGRRASRRAHSWDRRVRERTARVHLQHVLSRARSGRADRKLRALHAWLPAEPGGTPAGGGLVSLDSKRLVTKLIAGWIVLPAL